jgi:DNA-binding transcriptional ArsR family regulator
MTEETLEESIFKTLSHQKRRDILRVIGEKKEASFSEIKTEADLPDTPSLSYHLNTLNRLVEQKEGKYRLSDLGRDVFNLICKTTASSQSHSLVNRLRKELTAVIIANAVLWALALLAAGQFEGRLQQATIFSFAALWFTSNIILYAILMSARRTRKC